jgi:hypothetical protein
MAKVTLAFDGTAVARVPAAKDAAGSKAVLTIDADQFTTKADFIKLSAALEAYVGSHAWPPEA